MKAIFLILAQLFFVPFFAFAVPQQIKIPNYDSRYVRVTLPIGYSADKKWPVILLLHGYKGTGSLESFYLGMDSQSQRFGYILISPDGTKNSEGHRFWNAGSSCCDFENTGIDDVGFLKATLDYVHANYSTDRQRVSLIGHSNGGFMAYRLACEKTDAVTTVVSLAGTMSNDLRCANGKGVNVIHVHGTADATIAYAGGQVPNYAPYLGAEQTIHTWANINGCDASPTQVATFDFVKESELPGADTTIQKFGSCQNNVTTELWTIEGGSHIPSFMIPERTFTKELLSRLLSLRK